MSASSLLARLSFLGLAVLGTGCSEYEFAEQDLSVRYRSELDQVALQVDTRGLYGTQLSWSDSEELVVTRARDRVRRIAKGERYLHLLTFPFILDLDADADAVARPDQDDWISEKDWTRLRAVFLENVHVESASAYLDAEGDVGVSQTVRIYEAEDFVAALNEMISLGVRHELQQATRGSDDVSEMFASE